MPDDYGILRGRRGEASDVVPLCAAPSSIHENKMHAVRVARPDGKHLTVDDYQWIRRCLGLPDDKTPLVDDDPGPPCAYCSDHRHECVCRPACNCDRHRSPNGGLA